jgi:HK97 family phage major capsid protein
MDKILQLTEKRNELLQRAEALVTTGLTTPEQKEQYRKLIADSDDANSDLTALRRIERAMPNLPAVPAHTPAPVRVEVAPESREKRRAKISAAYKHLLRWGHAPNAPEQRDLITTNSDGTAVIPQEYEADYVAALRTYGPIAALAKRVTETTGRSRKISVSDDSTATMSYLAEDSSSSGLEADPTIDSVIPGTDSIVSVVKYSWNFLEDSFDLSNFIRDIAGIRVAAAVEYVLTLGKDNGTNTTLPNSAAGGILGSVATGVTGAANSLSAGPTYAQLAALQASVSYAYRVSPNAGYMASPSVFDFLVAQVDTTGRPLYKFDPNTGLLLIANKPLYINNAMPAYNAASSPICIYGDFNRSLAYLDGGGMRIKVLNERYADTLESAAVIYQRIGSAALLPTAVKSLVSAAS